MENQVETTDGKYDEFRNDNESLLAAVCYMIAVTNVEDNDD